MNLTQSLWIYSTCLLFGLFGLTPVNSTIRSHCPAECNCFPIRKKTTNTPPTYSKVPDFGNDTLLAVSCQREQLTSVPVGLARDTAVLFLSYNELSHINRSMFHGLYYLQALALAHNKITSINNDTFDDMSFLEQLDLSYNQISRIPLGTMCPWYRREYGVEPEISGCSGWITAHTQLRLVMSHNPWHCNCQLQEFVEEYSCAYEDVPCIAFSIDTEDPIGHCMSPLHMRDITIRRLSSSPTDNGVKLLNVCKHRQAHVDIPLLVTIFAWMGAVLGYVVYFISWNNTDMANHKSYLSTLNFRHTHQQESPLSKRDTSEHDKVSTIGSSRLGSNRVLRPGDKKRNQQPRYRTLPTVQITEPTSPGVWIPRHSEWDETSDHPVVRREQRSSEARPLRNHNYREDSRGPELILRTNLVAGSDFYRTSSL